MKLFTEIGRLTGIILTTVALGGVVAGGVTLGLGHNKTFNLDLASTKVELGIGITNWGSVVKVSDKDGKEIDKEIAKDTIEDTLKLFEIDDYKKFVQIMGSESRIEEKLKSNPNVGPIAESLKNPENLSNAVVQSYAMTVSGGVLISIGIVALIVGIILCSLSIGKKNKEK